MKARPLWLAAIVVSVITVGIGANLLIEAPMASLTKAKGWLNSAPLSAQELRGKVVLIDFWTYTCINWRRTLPYLRAWSERYRDQGLIVIGVHTPEFSFEKDLDNIRGNAREQRVDYPIAIDSDHAIWNAFSNHYWPAVYLVDARGHIRHHQFGEGDYERLEGIIQGLLREAGHADLPAAPTAVTGQGAEAAADWSNQKTPETYVGFGRADNFVSGGDPPPDLAHVYVLPAALKPNQWALAGDWTLRRESALLNQAGGRIAYRFHARDLHLVMGPATRATPLRFRVRLDGQPPGEAHGSDVDADGQGTLQTPRMYQLIRQQAPITDRTFDIEFLDAGAELFVFTFG